VRTSCAVEVRDFINKFRRLVRLQIWAQKARKRDKKEVFKRKNFETTKSAESVPVRHTYPSRVLSNHDDVFVHNPFRNFVSGNLQI
jgi:hypothetical protein